MPSRWEERVKRGRKEKPQENCASGEWFSGLLPDNRASTQVVGIRCRGVAEQDVYGFEIDAELTGRIGRARALVNRILRPG